jgi:hypothetical protein
MVGTVSFLSFLLLLLYSILKSVVQICHGWADGTDESTHVPRVWMKHNNLTGMGCL